MLTESSTFLIYCPPTYNISEMQISKAVKFAFLNNFGYFIDFASSSEIPVIYVF